MHGPGGIDSNVGIWGRRFQRNGNIDAGDRSSGKPCADLSNKPPADGHRMDFLDHAFDALLDDRYPRRA
jgi:hypothetical protein